MHDAWLAAMLCSPPRIMGRRLKPFSLSHSFILECAGNGYCGGDERGAAHFFECVDVCSRDWKGNKKRFARGRFGNYLFKRWVAKNIRGVSEQDVVQMEAYIHNFTVTPPRRSDGGGDELASPWQFRVVAWLMSRGVSEDRAWNMPQNLALCYFYAAGEFEGDKSLVPEWKDELETLSSVAVKLAEDGRKEDAEKVFAYVQSQYNDRNNATQSLEALING